MTSTERQRAWTKRQKAQGLVKVQGWVSSRQAADVQIAIRMMAANPDLALTVLRSEKTGRFVKVD